MYDYSAPRRVPVPTMVGDIDKVSFRAIRKLSVGIDTLFITEKQTLIVGPGASVISCVTYGICYSHIVGRDSLMAFADLFG